MEKKIKDLCNTPTELLKSAEKIELVQTAYDILDSRFASGQLAEMLMDENVTTEKMLEEMAVYYSHDRSSDFRKGFDKACEVFLWKSAPEIAVELLRKAEENDNAE